MTTIIINDDFDNDKYGLNYVNYEECGIYTLLNVEEIKFDIAHKFKDNEEININDVEKEVTKFLKPLIKEIVGETCDLLHFSNNKKVIL